ncbi:MAG: LysM peptidoglycan-binding domain-containing protein [Ilumatobacteraceae bacterium]
MMVRRLLAISVGCLGIMVLVSCATDGSNADFTLPVLRSVPDQTSVIGTTTTLPLFEEMYTIQEGDTLFEIAQAFGVTMDDLISYNAIPNPDAISAGQVLKVPAPANPSGVTTTTTSMAP